MLSDLQKLKDGEPIYFYLLPITLGGISSTPLKEVYSSKMTPSVLIIKRVKDVFYHCVRDIFRPGTPYLPENDVLTIDDIIKTLYNEPCSVPYMSASEVINIINADIIPNCSIFTSFTMAMREYNNMLNILNSRLDSIKANLEYQSKIIELELPEATI